MWYHWLQIVSNSKFHISKRVLQKADLNYVSKLTKLSDLLVNTVFMEFD